ncbi:hypothetical protein F442_06936 [Phytophthora nicotianae P10297]|uniref:Uncharacterized protein n=2 Tax=Phytophthora nicotianae TaxID=4792 RepID=W2ZHY0_PHYNI|nr:hypothetical protein L914_21704 [Phytophthora nicotianae]ETP46903.1 hypothetical protein F442_06936 [Phytophthora nicotianae P10297]
MDSEGQEEPDREPPCAAEPAISDFKRNWTDVTILALARAWRDVYRSGRAKDEKTTMFNERIFVVYKAAVPSTKRSKKALEDKLQGLREMYRFISDVNANRVQGSTGNAEWFDLSKQDKKELREFHRIKSPNISQQVYSELHSFLSDQPDTTPLESTFTSQPRFSTADTQSSEAGSAFNDVETDSSTDPHNTGRKSKKRKCPDKYEQLRDMLDQRSDATLAQARLLYEEELSQRRQQHDEHMTLLRALLDKL